MTEKERVVLVGVETEDNYPHFATSMLELANLTKTAHGEVITTLVQKRPQVSRQTIIGKGKMEELAQIVDAEEIDLVIFNHELTPRQSQLIHEVVGVPVLDRVQLILDIFALRARSKEGKMQVELAQLNYLLPRLAGQGQHLSRQGGGIGARGPGETKLETDRRHIRNKLHQIRHELKEVAAHRQRTRQKRQDNQILQIGLIGYTNAGKSTILNVLTSADTYEKDQLFATLDPLTKKWRLPEGLAVTLTDTVGFIQDLPTQLVEAFHSTLEESQTMDLLLHVVDVSAQDRLQHEQTVNDLMSELGLENIPVLTIYNKADQLTTDFVPTLFPHVLVSAKAADGEEVLTQAIRRQLMACLQPYTLVLTPEKMHLLHQLKGETLVIDEQFDEEEQAYVIRGFAPENHRIWQLL